MSKPTTDSSLDVRHIPLSYHKEDSDASATRLVVALYPDWQTSEGKIEFVRFTDGITNTLLKAVKKRPGKTQHDIDQEAVLLRAYGEGTDVLIDREREQRAHSLLARRNLAPPLLARFDNGLLYSFIEGEVCTPENLREPRVYHGVADMLGKWHGSLPISAISQSKDLEAPGTNGNGNGIARQPPTPNMWTVMQSWIDVLPIKTDTERERKQLLQTELSELSAKIAGTHGLDGKDYVFSHCDLLSGNVILLNRKPSDDHHNEGTEHNVSFIDYEYATPAPAAFDIANHFAEWAGFECDHNAVPTKSARKDFLIHYLESFWAQSNPKASQDQKAESLPQLYDQVELYRGVPGFYWGIWALIQATISEIDFDYAAYAEIRLGEYWGWKAEMDGSRQSHGRELSVREKRWAEE